MASLESDPQGSGTRAANFLVGIALIVACLVIIGAYFVGTGGVTSTVGVPQIIEGLRNRSGIGLLGAAVMLVLVAPTTAMLLAAISVRKSSPRSVWIALGTVLILISSTLIAVVS